MIICKEKFFNPLDNLPNKGFNILMSDLLIERFDPIPAILKSKYYKETRGFVVGKEHNVKFGGFRYIFEYNFPPLMRSTNLPATFPMGEMYVSENEIEFTKGVDK